MVVGVVTFLLPLLFAGYTQHLWEDFYITYRISQNLVAGHGLVFEPGEKVHAFTSPLGTLLPAFCSWVVGGHNDVAAVWIFRVINSGFLGGAAVLLIHVLERLQCSRGG
jgi:hypothetical protein